MLRLAVLAAILASLGACGYAGETGADYKSSLASKSVYSALQIEAEKLSKLPARPFIYRARDADTGINVIAIPLKNGRGFALFTADAEEGRVLSIPEDEPISIDLRTLRHLQRDRIVSNAVIAELVRRST